jgi:DNA-directed RNA polymerase subunit RPC12/RpoP
MPNATFFLQECPTCGRRLQVRVVYLGRDLSCPHCCGRFVARDPSMPRHPVKTDKSLLQKADELLAAASRIKTA